ncbi:MAG: DUF1311 domain-containing protein [Desulfovibrio sp.]|nr:DUF1311 domain-containing protein [Desulfovibrio sp.]
MEKAEGVTDAMLSCIQKEHAKWDKKLNANYKEAYDSLDNDKDKATLKAAQLAWITWKDKMAAAILLLEGDGSLARVSANSFIMEETKRQAERLQPIE